MAARLATLATCNLNQWALDFEGNLKRIKESIAQAKQRGASYRVGPELEVCGYGCEDHFLELDTEQHCWEALAELLADVGLMKGILVDIGMPVIHRGVLYNCRVLVWEGRVVLIRPKLYLANDGNYRETRYFAGWKHPGLVEPHVLPGCVQAVTGQSNAPFGDGVLRLEDCMLAAETCEELFTPNSPHIALALAGVEIISNGSGSHHQLRKLDTRLDLVLGATAKAGGVYLYANQRGCDGGRLYFDGCCCVAVNGKLVAQGSQFSLRDVEVVTADVDLDEVVSYRCAISSLREQASSSRAPTLVEVPGCRLTPSPSQSSLTSCSLSTSLPASSLPDSGAASVADRFTGSGASGGVMTRADMSGGGVNSSNRPPVCAPSPPIKPRIHLPEEEIAYGPAAWLWDYLRRSGAGGFLLPLSGGADSSSTAAIVGAMCQMIVAAVAEGDKQVEADARRITGIPPSVPLDDARALAYRLLVTVYLGTVNSSGDTRARSKELAKQIGSYHLELDIDGIVEAVVATFSVLMGRRPRFGAHGGTREENLALQNIQARLRMVVAFLLAQLVPWCRGLAPGGRAAPPPPPARAPAPGAIPVSTPEPSSSQPQNGTTTTTSSTTSASTASTATAIGGGSGGGGGSFLLVLGSANVDECLRGYLTKYDCSSADINPIGAISKQDLRRFLQWGAQPPPAGLGYPVLAQVEAAPPTAELEPIVEGAKQQNDEDDMGCTYEELSLFGRLRKVARAGPVAMFRAALAHYWQQGSGLSAAAIADKVKHFFRYYSINRHKATVLTPSYHAESYSPDDNRYDHRPFLYNVRWPWQFARIDQLVARAQQGQQAQESQQQN